MIIKTVFEDKWTDGDIITTDPEYGNQYMVDDELNLSCINEYNQDDFEEGTVFYKIAHSMTATNAYSLDTGVVYSTLISAETEQ